MTTQGITGTTQAVQPRGRVPGRLKSGDGRLVAKRWRSKAEQILAAHRDPETYQRALNDPALRDRRLSLAALQTVIERSIVSMGQVDDYLAARHASIILRCVRQREQIIDSMQRDYGDVGAIPRSALIRWLDDLTLLLAANPDQTAAQNIDTVKQAAAALIGVNLPARGAITTTAREADA